MTEPRPDPTRPDPTRPSEPGLGEMLRSDDFRADVVRQIGGWKGLAESAVPVLVFVVANLVGGLRVGLIASVAAAVLLAGARLVRRESPRQALNGLFGIAIAAFVAARTGEAADFYLPGIIISAAYSLVFFVSVLLRHPVVGHVWAFVAGAPAGWRSDPRLHRLFAGLTLLWGVVWVLKVGIQALIYARWPALAFGVDRATALGVARLALGYPPILLLIAITFWQVRRAVPRAAGPAPTADVTAAG